MIESCRDSLAIANLMERCRPELVAAGGLEGLGIEFGIALELLVDDGCDAALGAELC
jgi:hypothetical protein